MFVRLLLLMVTSQIFPIHSAHGQHCAPIVESYLSSQKIARDRSDLRFTFEYSKTGGRRKAAYQAYVLAFPDTAKSSIEGSTPQELIEKKICTVLKTQVAKRNKSGNYEFHWDLQTEPFVERLLKSKIIDEERVNDIGGWKSFDTQIRIAIFIPFLDDKKYSKLKGLPEDTHECNYANSSALLFETIPQKLTIHFGTVQAVRFEEGKHYVQVNGPRPPKIKSTAKK